MSPLRDQFLLADDFQVRQFWLEDERHSQALIDSAVSSLDA